MGDLRVRKLQEFIKQEISQMLMRGLKDPRISFVTVTDVEVTGDLRQAKVYCSFLGSEKEKEDSYEALCHATGHIRSELGRALHLRHVPEITFLKDTSLDYGMHIESLLQNIHKEEEKHKKDEHKE